MILLGIGKKVYLAFNVPEVLNLSKVMCCWEEYDYFCNSKTFFTVYVTDSGSFYVPKGVAAQLGCHAQFQSWF